MVGIEQARAAVSRMKADSQRIEEEDDERPFALSTSRRRWTIPIAGRISGRRLRKSVLTCKLDSAAWTAATCTF